MQKVSIIVPIYNVEKYLKRCLESLLNQTLRDIEIILVDDGSPDKCPQLCDAYATRDSRVKVIHKKNAGLGYARNSGLEIATGEFVAFVDSDDYVDLNTYKILYDNAKSLDADVVLCGFKRLNNEKVNIVSDTQIPQVLHGDDCISVLKGMIGISTNVQFYHFAVWHGIYRNALIQNNNVRFCSERDYISEDIVFHLSILPLCNCISVIPDNLYYYCLNENSLTTKYKPGRLNANIKLCRYISDQIFNGVDERLKKDIQENLDSLVIGKAISNLSYEVKYNKNCIPALKEIINNNYIRSAIKRYPLRLLSKKQYCLVQLIKNKCVYLLYIILNINSKIKYLCSKV